MNDPQRPSLWSLIWIFSYVLSPDSRIWCPKYSLISVSASSLPYCFYSNPLTLNPANIGPLLISWKQFLNQSRAPHLCWGLMHDPPFSAVAHRHTYTHLWIAMSWVSQEGLQHLSKLIGEGMRRGGLNFNHKMIIGLFEVLLSFFHLVGSISLTKCLSHKSALATTQI